MEERLARAFAGLGLVNEFLGHGVLGRAASASPIPVVFNGTIVGNGFSGRDCVSIDLSAAGDPLDVRHLRVAFGAYQRHRFRDDSMGRRRATRVPPLVPCPATTPPPGSGSPRVAISRARPASRRHAGASPAGHPRPRSRDRRLPRSPLAASHRAFYAGRRSIAGVAGALHAARSRRPSRLRGASLPTPNDLLLQPAHLQHVTRYFLSQGWPARTIAELVLSRYDGEFGWGDRWRRLDARTRAESTSACSPASSRRASTARSTSTAARRRKRASVRRAVRARPPRRPGPSAGVVSHELASAWRRAASEHRILDVLSAVKAPA